MYRYRSLSTIQGRNVEKFRMRVSAVSEQRMGQVVGCSHRQTMANVSSDGSSIRSLGYAYNTPPNNITWRFVCECLAPQKSPSIRPDATFFALFQGMLPQWTIDQALAGELIGFIQVLRKQVES